MKVKKIAGDGYKKQHRLGLQKIKMPLFVKRLVPTSVLPKKSSNGSAGFDLSSSAQATIPARGSVILRTGLSIKVPSGTYGRIAPRSGLAAKHSLDVGAGVVDPDFRGEVCIVMFNFSDEDYPVKEGERVAQLILEKIDHDADVVESEVSLEFFSAVRVCPQS